MNTTPSGIPSALPPSPPAVVSPIDMTKIKRPDPLYGPFVAPGVISGNGGSSHDFATGRINFAMYGPPDRRFFQRRRERFRICNSLGCAKRWVQRETFGRWRPDVLNVAATGFEDCPRQMRESWFDLLDDRGDVEIIKYERHGDEGQYPNRARDRARAAAANLVEACCDRLGIPAASHAIDGLPLVKKGSVVAREVEASIAHGIKVYGEAFPEQEPDTAADYWASLPAMSTVTNVEANPLRRPAPAGVERIVLFFAGNSGWEPDALARFLNYCALNRFTPFLHDDALIDLGTKGHTIGTIQTRALQLRASPNPI